MTGRWGTALVAVSALACANDAITVQQAPVTLARSPAEVFANRASIAVAAVLDDGAAREVTLSAEAQVSLRAYGVTVTRASQPAAVRPLPTGQRVTFAVHTAITQLDPAGRAVGRIENPFAGTPGRARLGPGRSFLVVVADDPTDAAAWRVLEAYSLNSAGDNLAEPALGFPSGTAVDALLVAP